MVPVIENVQNRAFDSCIGGHIDNRTLSARCLNGVGGIVDTRISLFDCFVNQNGQLRVSHALHGVAKAAF